MNFKLIRTIILLVTLAVFSGGVGYKLGTNQVKLNFSGNRPKLEVLNREPSKTTADFTLFWEVWDEVSQKYVDKTKLDAQEMVYGAISGMVESLDDPYTVFLPPKANQDSKDSLNGTFEGIGAQLDLKDGQIVVVEPLPDSPSKRAGLRNGDAILKVNGEETQGWSLPEAIAKIRGPKGTTVTLTVAREGEREELVIPIVRDNIILKSVEWQIVSSTGSGAIKKAAYIKLARFGEQTDPQWNKAIDEITGYLATQSGSTAGVILDVRNNPGGYLAGSVYTAAEFMDKGVVVKQQDYTGRTETYSINRRGRMLSVPLVVLVNKGSASAAEILAGALRVSKRAKIVGDQTFGKGSVQDASDFADGSGLHVTIAKWLLADDTWIQGTGLTPDIKIVNDPDNPTFDSQLDAAVRVLNGLVVKPTEEKNE